jgi:hypothetical protein
MGYSSYPTYLLSYLGLLKTVHCMHGIRLHTTCHDPAVQALVHFLDAIHGSHRVIAERGGLGGHRGLDQWMQGPGAGLRHIPDIVRTMMVCAALHS